MLKIISQHLLSKQESDQISTGENHEIILVVYETVDGFYATVQEWDNIYSCYDPKIIKMDKEQTRKIESFKQEGNL